MATSSTQGYDSLGSFVDDLQATGTYTFSLAGLRTALVVSEIAAANAVRRLKERGRLVSPRRGFYVIVPMEYRASGSPPPSWFIDDLMRFLGQPYYVGLLSAALLHGASHQQPMVFQVVTDRPTRSATAGRSRIEYHVSRQVNGSDVTEMQTETGSMRVSAPETTAFDVVRYPSACGGWSNVATVLAELAERLDPQRLAAVAGGMKTPEVQRLGYLLDQAGHPRLADPLLRTLAARRYRPVRLSAESSPPVGLPEGPWRVIDNVHVELDS